MSNIVIRTKDRRPSSRHNLALTPTLEQNRFVVGSGAVREGTHGEGGLVFICGEHIVQPFVSEGLEEVFSA
jgi:hypothetical protein